MCRVREAGRRPGLSDEPLARRRVVSDLGRQDLDGDVAIQLDIAREVDHPHAASAEFALERVLTGQGGLEVEELGGGIGHCRVLYDTKSIGVQQALGAVGMMPISPRLAGPGS